MTQKIRVADEDLATLFRREQELNRRITEGTLDINKVLVKLQRIIEGELEKILFIYPSLSLSDRIAAGKYNWVNSDITEKNFPTSVEKDYEVEYRIFHFNRSISSESAIVETKKEGFRAGNSVELLKLGEIKPELQREFPIVALGSSWRDARGRRVPVLGRNDDKRVLDLRWFEGVWNDNFRFLGVRHVGGATGK
jgi:hypothetical protein